MRKTSAATLECLSDIKHLEDLRRLITLEICEQPGIENAMPTAEIHWDDATKQIVLPIAIMLENGTTLPMAVLKRLVAEVSKLYLSDIGHEYHGVVRIINKTR